jgi:hypothetical protein
MPELFWHYLSDADIRFKDQQLGSVVYARSQDKALRDLLLILDDGRIPP